MNLWHTKKLLFASRRLIFHRLAMFTMINEFIVSMSIDVRFQLQPLVIIIYKCD